MLVRSSNVHATAAGKDAGSNRLKKEKENCIYTVWFNKQKPYLGVLFRPTSEKCKTPPPSSSAVWVASALRQLASCLRNGDCNRLRTDVLTDQSSWARRSRASHGGNDNCRHLTQRFYMLTNNLSYFRWRLRCPFAFFYFTSFKYNIHGSWSFLPQLLYDLVAPSCGVLESWT